LSSKIQELSKFNGCTVDKCGHYLVSKSVYSGDI